MLPMNALMRRFFDELELSFEFHGFAPRRRLFVYKEVFFTEAAGRHWVEHSALRKHATPQHKHGDLFIEAAPWPMAMTWHLDQCCLKQAGLPHMTLRGGK